MEKTQLKLLEKKIFKEIQQTEAKIKQYSQLCKPIAPENSIGRVSRMDAINNKSVVEAVLRAAIEKMQKLKTIQSQINDSDFGICNKCNEKIPFQRLMIQPQSKLCVLCAQ